jgi:hypothetical protein
MHNRRGGYSPPVVTRALHSRRDKALKGPANHSRALLVMSSPISSHQSSQSRMVLAMGKKSEPLASNREVDRETVMCNHRHFSSLVGGRSAGGGQRHATDSTAVCNHIENQSC